MIKWQTHLEHSSIPHLSANAVCFYIVLGLGREVYIRCWTGRYYPKNASHFDLLLNFARLERHQSKYLDESIYCTDPKIFYYRLSRLRLFIHPFRIILMNVVLRIGVTDFNGMEMFLTNDLSELESLHFPPIVQVPPLTL